MYFWIIKQNNLWTFVKRNLQGKVEVRSSPHYGWIYGYGVSCGRNLFSVLVGSVFRLWKRDLFDVFVEGSEESSKNQIFYLLAYDH